MGIFMDLGFGKVVMSMITCFEEKRWQTWTEVFKDILFIFLMTVLGVGSVIVSTIN